MWRIAVAGLVPLLIVACGRSEQRPSKPKELETVEIGDGYDANLSTEEDQRERRVEVDMGGVLPTDFPAEMPIFTPSSIVDFGQPGGSGNFVVVDSPVPRSEVESSLASRIQRAGWTVDAIGDEGKIYSRQGRRVRVIISDLGSGSRIRYEY